MAICVSAFCDWLLIVTIFPKLRVFLENSKCNFINFGLMLLKRKFWLVLPVLSQEHFEPGDRFDCGLLCVVLCVLFGFVFFFPSLALPKPRFKKRLYKM